MSNYEMPDLSGANCAGISVDVFYDEVIVEKAVDVEVGDSTYQMYRSTAPIQHAYLRQMCMRCPVLQECREWAITHENYGFWGGMTATERASERVLRGIELDEPEYTPPTRDVNTEHELGVLPYTSNVRLNMFMKEFEKMNINYVHNGVMEGAFDWM